MRLRLSNLIATVFLGAALSNQGIAFGGIVAPELGGMIEANVHSGDLWQDVLDQEVINDGFEGGLASSSGPVELREVGSSEVLVEGFALFHPGDGGVGSTNSETGPSAGVAIAVGSGYDRQIGRAHV